MSDLTAPLTIEGNAASKEGAGDGYTDQLRQASEGNVDAFYRIVRSPLLRSRLGDGTRNVIDQLERLADQENTIFRQMHELGIYEAQLTKEKEKYTSQKEDYQKKKDTVLGLEAKARDDMSSVRFSLPPQMDAEDGIHEWLTNVGSQHKQLEERMENLQSMERKLARDARTAQFTPHLRTYNTAREAYLQAKEQVRKQAKKVEPYAILTSNLFGLDNETAKRFGELVAQEEQLVTRIQGNSAELKAAKAEVERVKQLELSSGLEIAKIAELEQRQATLSAGLEEAQRLLEENESAKQEIEQEAKRVFDIIASQPNENIVVGHDTLYVLEPDSDDAVRPEIVLYTEAVKEADRHEGTMINAAREMLHAGEALHAAEKLKEGDSVYDYAQTFISEPFVFTSMLDELGRANFYARTVEDRQRAITVLARRNDLVADNLKTMYRANELRGLVQTVGDRILTEDMQATLMEAAAPNFKETAKTYRAILRETAEMFGIEKGDENETRILESLATEIRRYTKASKVLQAAEQGVEQSLGSVDYARKTQKVNWDVMLLDLTEKLSRLSSNSQQLDETYAKALQELSNVRLGRTELELAAVDLMKEEYTACITQEQAARTAEAPTIGNVPANKSVKFTLTAPEENNTWSLRKLWAYENMPDIAAVSSLALAMGAVQATGALFFNEPNELGRVVEQIELLVTGGYSLGPTLKTAAYGVSALAGLTLPFGARAWVERHIERMGKTKGLKVANVGEDRVKGPRVAGAHTISAMSDDVRQYLGGTTVVGTIDSHRIWKEIVLSDAKKLDGSGQIRSTNPSFDIMLTKGDEMELKIAATTTAVAKEVLFGKKLKTRGSKIRKLPLIGKTIDSVTAASIEITEDPNQTTVQYGRIKHLVKNLEVGDSVLMYHRVPDGKGKAFFEIYPYTISADTDRFLSIEGVDEVRVVTGEDSRMVTRMGMGGIRELEQRYATSSPVSRGVGNSFRL